MRIFAVIAIAILSLLSAACAVRLQPPQQGEWSDFNDKAHQTAPDLRYPGEAVEK